MNGEFSHPSYGKGEILTRYGNGSILVRFSDLPGGKYAEQPNGKRTGPVITTIVAAVPEGGS